MHKESYLSLLGLIDTASKTRNPGIARTIHNFLTKGLTFKYFTDPRQKLVQHIMMHGALSGISPTLKGTNLEHVGIPEDEISGRFEDALQRADQIFSSKSTQIRTGLCDDCRGLTRAQQRYIQNYKSVHRDDDDFISEPATHVRSIIASGQSLPDDHPLKPVEKAMRELDRHHEAEHDISYEVGAPLSIGEGEDENQDPSARKKDSAWYKAMIGRVHKGMREKIVRTPATDIWSREWPDHCPNTIVDPDGEEVECGSSDIIPSQNPDLPFECSDCGHQFTTDSYWRAGEMKNPVTGEWTDTGLEQIEAFRTQGFPNMPKEERLLPSGPGSPIFELKDPPGWDRAEQGAPPANKLIKTIVGYSGTPAYRQKKLTSITLSGNRVMNFITRSDPDAPRQCPNTNCQEYDTIERSGNTKFPYKCTSCNTEFGATKSLDGTEQTVFTEDGRKMVLKTPPSPTGGSDKIYTFTDKLPDIEWEIDPDQRPPGIDPAVARQALSQRPELTSKAHRSLALAHGWIPAEHMWLAQETGMMPNVNPLINYLKKVSAFEHERKSIQGGVEAVPVDEMPYTWTKPEEIIPENFDIDHVIAVHPTKGVFKIKGQTVPIGTRNNRNELALTTYNDTFTKRHSFVLEGKPTDRFATLLYHNRDTGEYEYDVDHGLIHPSVHAAIRRGEDAPAFVPLNIGHDALELKGGGRKGKASRLITTPDTVIRNLYRKLTGRGKEVGNFSIDTDRYETPYGMDPSSESVKHVISYDERIPIDRAKLLRDGYVFKTTRELAPYTPKQIIPEQQVTTIGPGVKYVPAQPRLQAPDELEKVVGTRIYDDSINAMLKKKYPELTLDEAHEALKRDHAAAVASQQSIADVASIPGMIRTQANKKDTMMEWHERYINEKVAFDPHTVLHLVGEGLKTIPKAISWGADLVNKGVQTVTHDMGNMFHQTPLKPTEGLTGDAYWQADQANRAAAGADLTTDLIGAAGWAATGLGAQKAIHKVQDILDEKRYGPDGPVFDQDNPKPYERYQKRKERRNR